MKGDFSKDTFVKSKHFRDVLMQQGRVLLCSEWNEQATINSYRTETITEAIIGPSGTPKYHEGFRIDPAPLASPPNSGVTISAGHFYVDGILCVNEKDVLSFGEQPDFDGKPLQTNPGLYAFYLDVWLRHITALEDESLKEIALNGPDTTTRSKVVWQVKCIEAGAPGCATALGIPDDTLKGKLMARAEISNVSEDPCGLVKSGGYKRMENQLYRVEIHQGGDTRATTRFKWSRDNGSILATLDSYDAGNNRLVLVSKGRDELLDFKKDNWVELINDFTDLSGKPGILVKLANVDENVLTISTGSIIDHAGIGIAEITSKINGKNPRVRRWDSVRELSLNSINGIDPVTDLPLNPPVNNAWVTLEDGVQVCFTEGTYTTGDYWLIPGRTIPANVEYSATAQYPSGIKHHYAKLAMFELTAAGWELRSDCRPIFPPVTELTSLYYVGGDGQEARPNQSLPDSLKVGVANGQWAVNDAKVKFEFIGANGGAVLNPVNPGPDGFVPTNAAGIAECRLTLGNPTPDLLLSVKAILMSDVGVELADHLPVIFNATFNVASNIKYDDESDPCDNWKGAPHGTVEEAITSLCRRTNETKKHCSVTVGDGGDFPTIVSVFEKAPDKNNICICLLPQNHILRVPDDKALSAVSIKISGCGATVKMDGFVTLKAFKITLSGFALETGKKSGALTLISEDLVIEHCNFTRQTTLPAGADPAIQPFISVIALEKSKVEAQFHLNNNYFSSELLSEKDPATGKQIPFADDTLAIYEGTEIQWEKGWIEDNEINGQVKLRYAGKEKGFQNLFWKNDNKKISIIDAIINKNILIAEGALTIRGNIVDNVFTNGINLIKPDRQKVYKHLFVNDNVFKRHSFNVNPKLFSDNSSFIAESVTMCNNHFLLRTDKDLEPELAFVAGASGSIIGNIGPAGKKYRIEAAFPKLRLLDSPTLVTIAP